MHAIPAVSSFGQDQSRGVSAIRSLSSLLLEEPLEIGTQAAGAGTPHIHVSLDLVPIQGVTLLVFYVDWMWIRRIMLERESPAYP